MEDSNTWECSVCTYHNSAEAFKCLMCDVRKGTSTRKPRINPEMVAKQVARQQEQIKQQALKSVVKVKPDKISRRNEDSNSSIASVTSSGPNSPHSPPANGSICSNHSIDSHSTAISSTSFFDKINSLTNTASSSKALFGAPTSSQNSDKNDSEEEEVDENEEVESTPPRNCGSKGGRRTAVRAIALRARLKNVDRTDVESKEVTVNNITVLITEYKVKRKLSEVTENKFTPEVSPKKIKEEKAKEETKEKVKEEKSPEKSNSKESVSSSRGKGSLNADKKSPNKGKAAPKGDVESSSKKRSSNSSAAAAAVAADSTCQHGSPSKKVAPVADN